MRMSSGCCEGSIFFKCREGFDVYFDACFDAVQQLMEKCEEEHWSEQFALYIHYEDFRHVCSLSPQH